MAKKKKSRKIPNKTSDVVKQMHFFECAWCGVKLFERHHIQPFHMGGEHAVNNLILLCPNHHTLADMGAIAIEELKLRKSTHVKGDRLTGDFKTSIERLKVATGGGFIEDVPTLLAYKGYPIFQVYKEGDNLLINAKFYNKHGALVFWMYRNMYWSHVHADISAPRIDELEIKNKNESVYLKIMKVNDYLEIKFVTYLGGKAVAFSPDGLRVGTNTFRGNMQGMGSGTAFDIA